ncbi:MAG TPA: hypothetical protein VHY91_25250 [Pirellulales bacterium]|nr:hypothetical protein [Pirellulales bacterium]
MGPFYAPISSPARARFARRSPYGDLTPDGVRPSVTKNSFIGRWNQKIGLPSLPNYRLFDHFQGKDTLYFLGNGRYWAKRTLVMIDIDVLKSKGLGSPAGASRFAQHLTTIWPDLYFEPSTNGKGIHGYFVLWKRQYGATQVNNALKRLEKWLRAEAKKVNADIEQVEIKGTCPDIEFTGSLMQSVKYGYFAKIPRDISRFAEWEKTTVLRVQDLESRTFDVVVAAEPESVKQPESLVKVSVPQTVKPARQLGTAMAGSVSGRFISDDELASIPQFERLYQEWVGPVGLKARKFSVTAHDFAVAMVILRHYKADPNSDGSLPCRRIEKIWTALFHAGDIDRPWNHHRWKAIRDFLSANGHIDWTDHRYEYSTVATDDRRTKKKGIACKWSITDGYDWTLARVASLPTCREGEASFVDTAIQHLIPTQGNGENLKPTPFLLRVELEQKFWFRAYEACELLFAA